MRNRVLRLRSESGTASRTTNGMPDTAGHPSGAVAVRRCSQRYRSSRALPLWVLVFVLMLPALTLAQAVSDPTPLQYRDAAEEARFHALAAELRCVQCQNQSLADSNAQIAHDLRREVLTLMQQGRTDAQIKQFLVDRYGEFVLYRPLMDTRNSVLWFGPVALVLGGAGVLAWVVRRRSRQVQPMGDSEERW